MGAQAERDRHQPGRTYALRAHLRRLPPGPLLASPRPLHEPRDPRAARPHALCHRGAQGPHVGHQEGRAIRPRQRHGLGRPRVRARADPSLGPHGLDGTLRGRQARDPAAERSGAPPERPGPRRRAGRGALRHPRLEHAHGRPRGRRRGDPDLQRLPRRVLRHASGALRRPRLHPERAHRRGDLRGEARRQARRRPRPRRRQHARHAAALRSRTGIPCGT